MAACSAVASRCVCCGSTGAAASWRRAARIVAKRRLREEREVGFDREGERAVVDVVVAGGNGAQVGVAAADEDVGEGVFVSTEAFDGAVHGGRRLRRAGRAGWRAGRLGSGLTSRHRMSASSE